MSKKPQPKPASEHTEIIHPPVKSNGKKGLTGFVLK
ncbi:hypothetical protein SOV_04590 [Sporomusa ovata DSM 2662]|nr:hypothetical protein SOV_2c10520 [Sporomusa ovata DSM 2662]